MKTSTLLVAALALSNHAGCGLEPGPACANLGDACCPPWTRADDEGCVPRRWTTAVEIGEGVDGRVAVGHDGDIATLWLEVDGLDVVPMAAMDVDGYRPRAAPNAIRASEPQVAVGATGEVVVLWREGTDIRLGAFVAGAWDWPTTPLNPPLKAAQPTIARGAGEFLVAWNQWTGANWGVATATVRNGVIERTPAHVHDVLSPAINFSNDPIIAANADGEAVITWYQATTDRLMTYVSEKGTTSAYYSRPKPEDVVSPFGADVDHPQIAMDLRGDVAAVWRQETLTGRHAVFMATRRDGAWTTPYDLDDSFSVPADTVFNTRTAFTDAGDLYVTWQQDQGGDKAVFLAHRLPDGRWLAPGYAPLRLSSVGARGFEPALAAGRRGVVVSWTEKLEGEGGRVFVRRSAVDAEGDDEAARWGSPTVLSDRSPAGGSRVAIGGHRDRVACVWVEGGSVRLATID